ncbi:MAG: hypothetical protein J5632_00175 [Bacteroidales bacterium]|nr:hypothetical protein [Bacteroidales bacterium]
MRKYLYALILAAILPLAGGHVLTKLWQNFDSAVKADKPQDELKALDAIKKEARSKHLTWDYYEACTRYVDVASSVNWKLRDSLAAQCSKEISAFGEPVAVYYLIYVNPLTGPLGQDAAGFAKENRKKLLAAKNPDFYAADWHILSYRFGEWLKDNLANDYEYVLWSIGDKDALKEHFAGKYPMGALVEYLAVTPDSDRGSLGARQKALQAFAAKYAGKAVALFAEEDLLQLKFRDLEAETGQVPGTREASGKGSGAVKDDAPYKALYEECKALIARRKAFKGSEKALADCCTIADALAEQLTAPGLDVSVVDGEALVVFRNLNRAKLEVEKHSVAVENPAMTFYLPDTVKVTLPALNDGEYNVKCSSGKLEDDVIWRKYTIAASLRYDADGPAVWAADYLSGEPLPKVDIELVRNKEVAGRFEGISLNGFTPIPKELIALAGKGKKHDLHYVRLVCAGENGITRASRTIALRPNYKAGINDDPTLRHCQIFTDRRAYNPGETLRFKAIVYYGKYSYTKASKGEKYRAVLKDTEGNVLGSLDKTTGAFGGFGGPFVLTRTQKNGWYRLYIEDEAHNTVASTSVLVDDFVLPTFDVVFDRQPEQWLPLEKISVSGKAAAYSGHSLSGADASWSYTLNGENKDMGKVEIAPDGSFKLDIPVDAKASYIWYSVRLKLSDASGETQEFSTWGSVGRKSEQKQPTEYYFEDLGGDAPALKVVAGHQPVWLVYEVHGSGDVLLAKGLQEIAGQAGNDGKAAGNGSPVTPDPDRGSPATTELRFDYEASWPDAVTLNVIYFQNKKCYSKSISRRRPTDRWDLPLEFTRFQDTTLPGQQYSFGIKTGPDAECTAVIFDKATERFAPNGWQQLLPAPAPLPGVYYTNEAGFNDGQEIAFYKVRNLSKSAMGSNSYARMAVVEESATMDAVAAPAAVQAGEPDILIREDFATTIAWVPALVSDSEGNIEFKFTNADKLSTFWVQLFAHDKTMRSASLRREMKVTLPVKVSLAQPQFLYEGDRYIARVALANSTAGEVRGTLSIDFFDGDYRSGKLLHNANRSISVPANGNVSADEAFKVPEGVKSLGIKAVFRPEIADQVGNDGSVTPGLTGSPAADAIFVAVPILAPYQTITEAHSAVLLSGADRAATEKALREAFVNIPGSQASLKEISILDMIKEAVPKELEPGCDNAIALAKALQAYSICRKLGQAPDFDEAGTRAKLLACKCDDGGFAWFAGMESSLQVTAFILESLGDLGIIDEAAALQYVDKAYFNRSESLKRAWWYRGISMEEYLHLRSLFPGIPFKAKTDAAFRKAARKYLIPKKERGLNGAILAKARRMRTLKNLSDSDEGLALAKKMGIKLAAAKKIRRSLDADLASLLQYSQPHKHGGIYYPNAVMPWRGLMGSELYAHTLICKLLAACGEGKTADGIRLWMMLQKETQHWESDPAFVGAVACVLDASPAVLDTRVLALSGSFTKPFAEIKAAGNGMSILSSLPATTGNLGDRVTLSWKLSSEENRSFVKVSLPVPAGLQPVNQVSGWHWGYYRNVTPGCIERWYENYPEETITVSEDFYVVRAGEFQASVPVIECLYAPHYRANGTAGLTVIP